MKAPALTGLVIFKDLAEDGTEEEQFFSTPHVTVLFGVKRKDAA